jgi:hypothetical protein
LLLLERTATFILKFMLLVLLYIYIYIYMLVDQIRTQ